ncbi:MAG TPA: nitroreductase family deazaflavin-dependent oxidoreductase [Galbitalea sp.]|jgi:deazaflavin-dependent oxidoreductase (nitroreductase family)
MKGKGRLARVAELLYRAGLGFVFGSRLVMVEHFGRTTGKRRYVVIKILDRPSQTSWLVASRDGDRSQWYRNVIANPRVRLYLGSRQPVDAIARRLPAGKARAGGADGASELVLFEAFPHF